MECPNCGNEDFMHDFFEEEQFYWCSKCGADCAAEVANDKEEQIAWEVMEDAIAEEQERICNRDEVKGKSGSNRIPVLGRDQDGR